MRPKLTIVTPSLNQGAFIERTIRSVLDQGYENLEYVVVDGGSTDETVEVIRRYEDRLAWWVREPDEGQTDAINKGIERTSGEIVAYINSDDYYLPGAFEVAVAALAAGDARWVAGAARFVDEHEELLHVWTPTQPRESERTPAGRQWWMLAPWAVPQPSTFWRRDVFEEFGPFRRDMHYAFDTEHNLRVAYAGAMPRLVSEELSVRYLHDAAKSADAAPFMRDLKRIVKILTPQLTAGERRRLAVIRALRAAQVYRVRAWVLAAGVRIGPLLPDFMRPSQRRQRLSPPR